jgi:centromere protein B
MFALEKLESALAAWFNHACESDASTDGTHLKEKTLHIAAHLGIANFSASNGWINKYKRREQYIQNSIR